MGSVAVGVLTRSRPGRIFARNDMQRLTPLVFFSFVAGGCGGAGAAASQRAWAKAVSSDTCDAYGAFLAEFPQSTEAADARSRQRTECEKADWEKAKSANTRSSYEAYLQRHEDGQSAADARKELAVRAVTRVSLEVSSRDCAEDSCPFIAVARKVLKNAGIEVVDRSDGNDVLVKIVASLSLLDANRTETVPYSSLQGSISVQAGGTTTISRQFSGRAMGGWEAYGVHMTPRWPSSPTVFNAAPFEDTMTSLVKDFFGR
jgi:hypothetical protein